MIGNETENIIIQDRDRALLKEMAELRVIDRQQAALIAGFRSTTRVNTRLRRLANAGLLKRAFLGTAAGGRKALYSVSAKGAALVGAPIKTFQRRDGALLIADFFVQHQLEVNTVLLQFKYVAAPRRGVVFHRSVSFLRPISSSARLIPDGYMEVDNSDDNRLCMFLEVDRGTEASRIWDQKIQAYLHLAVSGEFRTVFHGVQFRVLVTASSERRLQSIRTAVHKQTDKIFWFATFPEIQTKGVWAPVWRRPLGDQRTSLV